MRRDYSGQLNMYTYGVTPVTPPELNKYNDYILILLKQQHV